MPCLSCNTDCSTIGALLPANGCKKTNASKPTGFYISSYPLPELSADALFDPTAPADLVNFTTDFNARLDNTDVLANDVIRCFCAGGTIPDNLPIPGAVCVTLGGGHAVDGLLGGPSVQLVLP